MFRPIARTALECAEVWMQHLSATHSSSCTSQKKHSCFKVLQTGATFCSNVFWSTFWNQNPKGCAVPERTWPTTISYIFTSWCLFSLKSCFSPFCPSGPCHWKGSRYEGARWNKDLLGHPRLLSISFYGTALSAGCTLNKEVLADCSFLTPAKHVAAGWLLACIFCSW